MRAGGVIGGARLATSTVLLALSAILLSPSARVRADDAPEDPPPAAEPPAGTDGGRPGADPDAEPAVPDLVEGIEKAIRRGVKWIVSQQKKDGSWGDLKPLDADAKTYNGGTDVYTSPIGPTALVVYTLVKCGVPVTDPTVRMGFDWLRARDPEDGTAYEISAMLLAVTATGDPFGHARETSVAKDAGKLSGPWLKWAIALKTRLLKLQAPDGWRYWGKKDGDAGGKQDLSSTQLAALALLSADRCGITADSSVWTGILRFALAQQEKDGPAHPRAVLGRASAPKAVAPAPAAMEDPPTEGSDEAPPVDDRPKDKARGFAYVRDGAKLDESSRAASGGMTACGVATLMIARYVLTRRYVMAWKSFDTERVQRGVYDGLAWLDLHWDPIRNTSEKYVLSYPLYYLYCVERAMDLVGGWKLGSHVWYVEMTRKLLPRQKEAGFWDSGLDVERGPVLDTCFALLFLRRATRGGIPFPTVTGGSDTPPQDGR